MNFMLMAEVVSLGLVLKRWIVDDGEKDVDADA